MPERGSQLIRDIGGLSSRANNVSGEVDLSALENLHAIPDVDSVANAFIRDVLGGKADTASTTLVNTDSLVSYVKGLLNQHLIPTVDSTDNVVISDVLGGKADTASTAVVDTDSVMSYLKGLIGLDGSREVFPSTLAATVVISATEADVSMPDVIVTVAAGRTIKRVRAAWAWRKQVDSSGSINAVNGADQTIQVRDDSPSSWLSAITMSDNSMNTGANATEGGMLMIGVANISATVDGTDIYNFQWVNADMDGASLTFYDVTTYLIVEYN